MTVTLVAAAAVAAVMLATWGIATWRRDVSLVDIVWGPSFAVVATVGLLVGDGSGARRVLLAAMVGLWGLRLGAYLAWRNLGHGEDKRYRKMRERVGERFWLVSLVTVFGLQGLLVLVVSLPVQLAAGAEEPEGLGPLAVVGLAVWLVGVAFEAVGDAQLARFKADPANEGEVMDRGLWAWTRHPNYFGDACAWWGTFLVAAEAAPARWGVVGPIVMTVLLLRVSGVSLLERDIGERRPGYADYVRRTSAFLPRPPKAGR